MEKDKRFDIIGQDPRFRRMPKDERKVKIDRRFEGMFKDKQFKLKYSVDKRGRPMKGTTDDNLRRFYEMSDSDDDSEEEDDGEKDVKSKSRKQKILEKSPAKQTKGKLSSKQKVMDERFSMKKLKQSAKDTQDMKLKSSERTLQSSKQHKDGDNKKSLRTNPVLEPSAESDSEEEDDSEEDNEEEEEDDESTNPQDDLEEEDSSDAESEDAEEDDGKSDDEDSSSSSSDDNGDGGSLPAPTPGPDLMRGEGDIESSSSDSDSSDSEEEDEQAKIEHGWGELDKEAPRDETVTTRLAVCNMDWDRLKAQDLLVLFNSFKPTGGVIKSVSIYPSEYGLQRMKDEDVRGPTELIEHKHMDEDQMKTAAGEVYRESLRKYQMQRLKYYYAVIACDSVETANSIYEQCDRLELESSSTLLDLRFIPEEMTFDDQEPKDVALDMPDKDLYEAPSQFRTTALHQSKVELTWDETDHVRAKKTIEVFKKKDLDGVDMRAYLASSSEEEEEDEVEEEEGETGTVLEPGFEIEEVDFGDPEAVDEEEQISKYKSLLQGINEKETEEKEKQMGMEITWEPGLKETTEALVKKRQERGGNAASEMTPWEQYLEKKKDKKKQKKDQKKNKGSAEDHEADDRQEQVAFSDDELPAGVDLGDSFFKDSLRDEEGTKNSNPSAANKKKNKKKQEKLTPEEFEEQEQKKAELELLMMDEDDNKQHFNLKDIMESEKKGGSKKKQRKRKRLEKDLAKPEDNFQIDVKDSRFDAIYSNHMYAIDPSVSHFKKTKSMDALLMEKQKRRKQTGGKIRANTSEHEVDGKKKSGGGKKDQELSMLVKSIKSKTQQFNAKKSKKDFSR